MERYPGAFQRATGRALEDDSGKPRYLRYQREQIEPYCGRSVLEIGAGTGEFAAQLTGMDRHVLTDVDADAVRHMARRFADRPEVETHVLSLDGNGPAMIAPVDTVIAINVLEHIEDDVAALQSLSRYVVPGGTVVLWVPASPRLYGEFDRTVGHFRRYTPERLREVFQRAGLQVRTCEPKNLLGAVAWWLAVRKGGSTTPNRGLARLYDRFVVPVTRGIEGVVSVPFGQSVLGVAEVA